MYTVKIELYTIGFYINCIDKTIGIRNKRNPYKMGNGKSNEKELQNQGL